MSVEITGPKVTLCGAGMFSEVAQQIARLGTKVAIVTGGHLRNSSRVAELVQDLQSRGIPCHISDPVVVEPHVETVDLLSAFLRENGVDVVVAVGGGSVMDTAKAAAVMATNEGLAEDYQLKRREIVHPPIAQVFAPTTAGTGSEATRVSVLTNDRVGIKRSISHPLMVPDVVVLDPELTVSLSKYFTTLTAMDAFAHAIESAVSKKSTPYTRHTALAGIEYLSAGLPRTQDNLNDLDARTSCLLGSYFAGLSMQTGLGASHSLAPAICIVSGIRHSEAVAALLPHAMRLNEREFPCIYDEVRRAMSCENIPDILIELCSRGGFVNNLTQFGLKRSDWPKVCEAMNRYGSHRDTNPVEVTDDYAQELFELACG